jgi:glycosyltransferase involved in cell wall biosynthesis
MLNEVLVISVIMPIYNAEKYLERSIGAVLGQSYENLEVILVDDGSTDNSGKIIDEFKKADTRIKVIHQRNQGSSSARNAGISVSTGKYISFVDSDDWIECDMYQKLYSLAEIILCDIVICDFFVEYKNSSKQQINKFPFESGRLLESKDIKEQICKRLLVNGFFTSACDKLYLRDFLVKNRISFEDGIKIREDYFFNMSVFDSSSKVF